MSRYLSVTITSLALITAAPVFALDMGTYRPGVPYNSLEANSPQACEHQCVSDSECRGWNFVKVSPQQANGVCELNARVVAPIPSPVSISGGALGRNASSRMISTGTNTVRVGQPSRQIAKPKVTQKSPTRRIVREAVPQRMQARSTSYPTSNMSLTQQQATQRGRAFTPQPTPRVQPQQHSQARPQFQHNLDNRAVMVTRPTARTAYAYPPNYQPQHQSRPHQMSRQSPSQHTGLQNADPRLLAARNQMLAQQHQQNMQATPPMAASPYASGLRASTPQPSVNQGPAAHMQSSLFGSLHDDVKVPRSITAQDAADPNAPIPTVTSVPTKKITTENLLSGGG